MPEAQKFLLPESSDDTTKDRIFSLKDETEFPIWIYKDSQQISLFLQLTT